jgi:hypothetical protein
MLEDPTMEGVRRIRRTYGYIVDSMFVQDEHNTDRDRVLERKKFRGKAIRGEERCSEARRLRYCLNVKKKRRREEHKDAASPPLLHGAIPNRALPYSALLPARPTRAAYSALRPLTSPLNSVRRRAVRSKKQPQDREQDKEKTEEKTEVTARERAS